MRIGWRSPATQPTVAARGLDARPGRTARQIIAAAAVLVLAAGFVTAVVRGVDAAGVDRGEVVNRARTDVEMTRLVGLARVPASAAATRDRPEALSEPEETPAAAPGALVDVTRFVSVGLSIADAQAYIHAHPPAPPLSGGGSAAQTLDRTGLVDAGYIYSEPDSAAWSDAWLEVTVTPSGPSATIWRIDGLAFVVDPAPRRVQQVSPHFPLTAAGSCPTTDNGGTVHNTGPDLGRELLPPGIPSAVLTCRYDPRSILSQQTRLTGTAARALATEVRATTLPHAVGPLYGCGLDAYTTRTVLEFTYPTRPEVDISTTSNGCDVTVDNGVISGRATPTLTQRIREGRWHQVG